MGVINFLEEAAGAVAAVEGAKKLDPDASILTEGAAAVAGFVGVEKVKEHFENNDAEKPQSQDAGDSSES
ncbi:hypothetical protein [Solilutibacter silvestris]|uniref:Uncharacterized protein n=1 Tax=Solilutibacter silvestris TaxID=1645665 RepID=A0A2K1Q4C1_9GAMM|nr:hypothetical protein [Lysobacter silvestris]PNS09807.1 hypothetical protein Lysil_1436 [Lysobacter silvestris]